ncbi:protein phosphatase regulator [Coprinopsis sp. MPI-PUGE-AT-0042]|nr:protein phosphatase regulator [Coprinopsis sp. MPI-PUGE-AT-0042]
MYSNAAGGPLPAIPRRPSNSRSASAVPQQSMKRATKSPYRMQRSSSCSDSDGHSGSAQSQAPARGPHPVTFPESLSTSPVSESFGSLRASKTEDNITLLENQDSSSRPKVYAPGMLKLSQSAMSSPDIPKVASRPPEHPGYIRKKSGQLVKPSLKTSKSANSVTFASLAGASKSEPATPVGKAVHFDTQLEHVKLFLAEQKPRAVSRDGSPTDDTSGTDSDFPSFIFGGDSTARRRGKLLIDVVNMPPRVNTYADLVAVRFTFDSWQTTSEVTARYQESISPEFDPDDLLARIEEKTLIPRGQELWDNNHTLNYVGKFTRSIRDRSLSDEEGDSKRSERTGPAFVAQAAVAVEAESDGPTFKSTSSFASRYDFSASLKNPWKYQESQPSHHRRNSFPQLGNPSSSSDSPLSPRATSPVKPDFPLPPPMTFPPPPSRPVAQSRNHRRGYFDVDSFNAMGVKMTPPTSPPSMRALDDDVPGLDAVILARSRHPLSQPSLGVDVNMASFGLFMGADDFDSELSTPSLATPSSSRETTPSPTERFADLPLGSDASHDYRDLINQTPTVTPTTSTFDFHVLSDSESRSATPVPMAASV